MILRTPVHGVLAAMDRGGPTEKVQARRDVRQPPRMIGAEAELPTIRLAETLAYE